MSRMDPKLQRRARRANRIRAVVSGSSTRPRLSVFVSNSHVSAQVIDDSKQITLASSTTVGQKQTGTLSEKATWVGEQIAIKAKATKVKQVVFDRNGRKYHGRVKALADAARKQGLEF